MHFETAPLPIDSGPWRTPEILRLAMRFLVKREYLSADAFAQLDASMRSVAFTIAGDTSDLLLATARASLEESLASGLSLDDAGLALNTALGAIGADPLRPWHARLVAQMAEANAFGFAQRQMFADPRVRTLIPLARYRHDPDVEVPRPAHLAMDGFVFDPAGPYAVRLRTPGGYGCMCWWDPVPADEAESLELGTWPEEDGVPVQVLDEGFAPSGLPEGITSREAALRAKLPAAFLRSLPASWKVIAVE